MDTHWALTTRPDHPRSSGASDTFDICPEDLRASGRVGSGLNNVCIIGGRRGWSGRVVSAQCVSTLRPDPTRPDARRSSGQISNVSDAPDDRGWSGRVISHSVCPALLTFNIPDGIYIVLHVLNMPKKCLLMSYLMI